MPRQLLSEKLFDKRKQLLEKEKKIKSEILKIENELRIITRPWMNVIKSNKKNYDNSSIIEIYNTIICDVLINFNEEEDDEMMFRDTTITVIFLNGYKLKYKNNYASRDCTKTCYIYYDNKGNKYGKKKRYSSSEAEDNFYKDLLSVIGIIVEDDKFYVENDRVYVDDLTQILDEMLEYIVDKEIHKYGWF